MYEIRIFRVDGEVELRYLDEPVRAGERLKIDGRRMLVLKSVRPSDRSAKLAFVCLEVPAPQLAHARRAA